MLKWGILNVSVLVNEHGHPPLFISTLEFLYDKYSVDKVWKKIYCHFYFRAFTLRTPEVLPVGKWIHVAASFDHGSGRNSLYINGHLRASDKIRSGYNITTNAERVRMGRRNFKGKIAEMKVYDVALNEAQIQTSIRQGSCTFPVIVVSLPYPMIALVIETPVTEQPRKIKQISVSGPVL